MSGPAPLGGDLHHAPASVSGEARRGGDRGLERREGPLDIEPGDAARDPALNLEVGTEPDAAPLPHGSNVSLWLEAWARPPSLEPIGELLVVRDDRIPGGTKARALPALLDALGTGAEAVYPSPAPGYAQVALAYAARATGRRAVVFTAARRELHARTLEARAVGARIVQVPAGYLSNVKAKARAYCELSGSALLPFGFDHPAMHRGIVEAARATGAEPEEVWSVAGSGALTRALQAAWPRARFVAVRIGMAPDAGSARVLRAPEAFERRAQERPPFPSCDNYDAKAWRFVSRQASPGALFWNVAA